MKILDKKKLDEKARKLGDLDSIIGRARSVTSDSGAPAEEREAGRLGEREIVESRRDDVIDLSAIWKVCATSWRMIAIGFAATLALAALVTLLVTPIYESTSVLLLRIGRESVYRPEVGNSESVINRDREAAVHGEVEILLSHDLHETLIREMGAETLYPDLVADDEPPEFVLERAVRRLRANLVVRAKPEANVIHVTFRHQEPETTAGVVNVLVELFKDKHLETFSDPRSTAFLEGKVAEYRQRLEKAEDDLGTYQLSNVSISLREERNLLPVHRAELAAALKQAHSEVAGLRAKTAYRDDLRSQAAGVTANPQQADTIDKAYARLLDLRLQERELLGRYTEKSRRVVNVRAQIQLVERSLEEMEERMKKLRPTELVDDNAELLFQEARVKALASQLAQLDGELAGIPAKERRLRELSRERDMAEENYQAHLKRLEEARILDEMDRERIANISVIQRAAVPMVPVRPRPRINLAVGAVLGIGVGLALALLAGPRFNNCFAVGPIMLVTGILAVGALIAAFSLRFPVSSTPKIESQTVASPNLVATGSPQGPPAKSAAAPATAGAERLSADETGGFLEAWAKAWSDQRADDYLRFYAGDFEVPEGMTRSDWERLRRDKLAAPDFIKVSITLLDSSTSEQGADVTFSQSYESDRFSDVVTKTLTLTREMGEWKILRETTTP